jgi:hypothetical protein
MTREIGLPTDNGSEFGGVSVDKMEYLNKAIFSVLNAKLVHIPKGKKEFNAYVERSQETDDNEFYIPQLQRCESLKEFMYRALRWKWFYNTKREHSMIKSTPYEYLKNFVSIDKSVGLFPVIILDNAIDILDTILPVPPGHNVSANDQAGLIQTFWTLSKTCPNCPTCSQGAIGNNPQKLRGFGFARFGTIIANT